MRQSSARLIEIAVALCLIVLASGAASVLAQAPTELPRVRVIGLGGTIAYAPQPGGGYEMRTVEQVVASAPEVARYAVVETEQFANVFSTEIAPDDWLRLAQRINLLFGSRADLAGVVVAHGTATLEELAFFLHLTITSARPVVLVAAQRPPTQAGDDGPANLLAGVRVAAAPSARDKGVLVVMDDRIISARDVKKQYARTGGFDAGEMGLLGVVGDRVDFFYAPTRRHTLRTDFAIRDLRTLPAVAINYSYSGSTGLVDDDARGVVVATTGFTPAERRYYEQLRAKGIVVVIAFPSGEDVNTLEGTGESLPSIVHAAHLTPIKARILLMLALTNTRSPIEIQRLFDSY